MDSDNFDDLLFGLPDSQESLDDIWSDISEEEMLDMPAEGESTACDFRSSPMLMPSSNNDDVPENINVEDAEANHQAFERPLRDRNWVIACIEALLETIVDALLEESESLTITLKSRAGLSRKCIRPVHGIENAPAPKEREISFPGSTTQEAWNFTVLLRILELIHGALIDDTVMTKRDIYYRHPDLFVKQSVVDRYVDDLACTFGIARSQLHVTAAAKGLVAGNFSILRNNDDRVDDMNDKEGLLVPKIGDHDTFSLNSVRWVLIIEKEATFRSLLSSPQWEALASHGIALTAKGYPDIASRRFLRQLADQAPFIPMYALIDLDPDGIAILSTYKYGSYRLAHEDFVAKDTPALSLPDVCWLGVRSDHINRTPTNECGTAASVSPELQGLMKLTVRDRTKAIQMLKWDLCAEDGPEQNWRRELQMMLVLNVKAEMQILDELPGGLVSWLGNKLEQAMHQAPEQPQDSSPDDVLLF